MDVEPEGVESPSLLQSLAGLSTVLMEASPLDATLTAVAEFAVSAIPRADGAGVTMLESGRPDVMAASTDFVTAIDDVQYRLGEGPCIAVEVGRTQVCGSLGGEARWPRFGPQAGHLGVHSVLSVPLVVADQVVGALNVYARIRDAFTAEAVGIGQRFAEPAAVTVANARVLEKTRRLAQQLQQALGSRSVIDQAIGILMSRSGVSADEAFERLRAISQGERTKLTDVAVTVVTQAVRRARRRH
jgi:transcriptional regulator with GAF, ATPase, and Fis domain